MEVVYFSLRFMSTFNFELFGIFERMRLWLTPSLQIYALCAHPYFI